MKLIDILVDRLPALGGWPIDSDDERTLASSLPEVSWGMNGLVYHAFRGPNDTVNYQQYEDAILVSKKEWDGEGLPPVGCEFEISFRADGFSKWHWRKCTAIGKHGVLCIDEKDTELYLNVANYKFRPIRSEADKKREKGVIALATADPKVAPFTYGEKMNNGELIGSAWYDLYDAIAAGKVPGIRIE